MRYVQPIRDLEHILKIKAILKGQSFRNYFLFVLGLNTGLRIGDILKLKVKDVKNKNYLTIQEEKTGNIKRFKLNSNIQNEIREYIYILENEDFLFPSRQGDQPIKRMMAYNIIKNAGNKIGLKEIGTHTLRKTFGYHFYKKTKDVALLQQIFNHSAPSVTLRYIGITQDIIDNALDDFSL